MSLSGLPIFITTAARPGPLLDLLGQLPEGSQVEVFHDVSASPDYSEYDEARELYWARHSGLWRDVYSHSPDPKIRYVGLLDRVARAVVGGRHATREVLLLQDDVVLCRDFPDRLAAARLSVTAADRTWAAANLHRDRWRSSLPGSACWTGVPPAPVGAPASLARGTVERVGWVDMVAVLVHRRLFVRAWRFAEVEPTPTSSGVPAALSRAATREGFGLYRTLRSLVRHREDVPSVMHADKAPEQVAASQTVDHVDEEAR